MSGENVTLAREPLVRYRDAEGGFCDCLLERVPDDALFGGQPVRDFRWYKGRRFYSGWYWSGTSGGLVAYESRLELARILLADFEHEVTAIAAQPFVLSGFDHGQVRKHVPDLLLRNRSGLVTVVDVKPEHRLADAKVAAVFGWTRQTVAQRGWEFEVWSGADRVLLENVRFLAGYRRRETIDTSLLPLALDAARGAGTFGGLESCLSTCGPTLLVRPVVLHLIWAGALRVDLSVPLSVSTPVWVRDGATL